MPKMANKFADRDILSSAYMNHSCVIFQLNLELKFFSDMKNYFKSIRITFRTPSEITISFFRFSFSFLKLKYCRWDASGVHVRAFTVFLAQIRARIFSILGLIHLIQSMTRYKLTGPIEISLPHQNQ